MALSYNPKLIAYSRQLRSKSTLSEVLLWQSIKGRQLPGYKFRRQKPTGGYIVDFFCPELMLAIEIDGSAHFQKENYDIKRQKRPEKLGIKILRFGDKQIKNNLHGVIAEIKDRIEKKSD